MGLLLSAGKRLLDLFKVLGSFVDFAAADPECYTKIQYDGKTWDIVEREGKRLKLRRIAPRVVNFFGRRITIYDYEVAWVKKHRNNVVSIMSPY